jgi:hypothetical protein
VAFNFKLGSKRRVRSLVIGAGASRDVLYGEPMEIESPLDADFFDLLRKVTPRDVDKEAVSRVLHLVQQLPYECWRSLERAFYTLHLHELVAATIGDGSIVRVGRLVEQFTICIETTLRADHGTAISGRHDYMFRQMSGDDGVLSFNYDFVAERALSDSALNAICLGLLLFTVSAKMTLRGLFRRF